MERFICLLIGYAFGLIQTGYIYGKMKGVDIRKEGSGNAGSTNALRTMGIKAGLVTLLGDCFKCVFAVVTVYLIYGKTYADIFPLLAMYVWMVLICLFAFLGIVAVTRYVSLGSLAVVIIYLIEVVVYGQMGGFGVKPPYLYEMYGIAAFLMLSAFYKHKANIVRLMNGTENKISIGKK